MAFFSGIAAAVRYTKEHEGGTFIVTKDGVEPTTPLGYAVGLVQGTYRVIENAGPYWSNLVAAAIYDVLMDYPGAPYVGTWMHDGVTEVDPVIVFTDLWSAVRLAGALGQQGVYDFATGNMIEVP